MRVSSTVSTRPGRFNAQVPSLNVQTPRLNLAFNQKRTINNRRDFLPDKNGKLKPMIYFSDEEILAKTSRSGELPDTYIPVMEPEVKITPARQFLNVLYKQFRERYNRHRNLVWFNLVEPMVAAGAWVAPSATVIGEVMLKENVSVWYNAVIRGDKGFIEIDNFTNIQDGAIITSDDVEDDSGFESKMHIGAYTIIGHNARLHSCKIGNGCLIGIGATVLEGAIVEDGAMVAAGAVVPPGRVIPSGELWAGNPAKFMRKLTAYETKSIQEDALAYVQVAQQHDAQFTTYSTAYHQVEDMAQYVKDRLPEHHDPLEQTEIDLHKQHKERVRGTEHFF